MARLQTVPVPGDKFLLVLDQLSTENAVAVSQIDARKMLDGCVGCISTTETMDCVDTAAGLLGVVEPVPFDDDTASVYFKSGWDAALMEQKLQHDVDLRMTEGEAPEPENAGPVSLAQLRVAFSGQELDLSTILAYAVSQAGIHAQYGPNIHTSFDSGSASAIVGWAKEEIEKLFGSTDTDTDTDTDE